MVLKSLRDEWKRSICLSVPFALTQSLSLFSVISTCLWRVFWYNQFMVKGATVRSIKSFYKQIIQCRDSSIGCYTVGIAVNGCIYCQYIQDSTLYQWFIKTKLYVWWKNMLFANKYYISKEWSMVDESKTIFWWFVPMVWLSISLNKLKEAKIIYQKGTFKYSALSLTRTPETDIVCSSFMESSSKSYWYGILSWKDNKVERVVQKIELLKDSSYTVRFVEGLWVRVIYWVYYLYKIFRKYKKVWLSYGRLQLWRIDCILKPQVRPRRVHRGSR